MMPYEWFQAWQLCHELTILVYRHTGGFPKSELYGLTSQARRAAFSAAANIAEGSAKRGRAEFRRYLDMSLGSLSELASILRLARDLDMITESQMLELMALRDHAGRVTWGLYRSLSDRQRGR